MIVCYKFGSRKNGDLSPREGIKLHLFHSEAHENKVLYTTNKFPVSSYRDSITEIILTTRDGSYAAIGEVVDLGRKDVFAPPSDYSVPSIYSDQEEETTTGWFAIRNLKKIEIKSGDFTSVNGKDLLESLSGNAYMVYTTSNED